MAAHKTICIVGSNGMLGSELTRLCPGATCLDVLDIDITDRKATQRELCRIEPRVVINAAAFTDVDGCETHEEQAYAVNADGVANLARTCRDLQAKLIHVSTDYVFDGKTRTPYSPDQSVSPINAYGRTKAAGEMRLRKILANHVIVRTSWLFGPAGRNFVKTMLRLARQRDEINVVNDQYGRPTYANDLADVLLRFADSDCVGTFHFANAGICSWYDFACEIVLQSGESCRVLPIASEDFPTTARRPAWSALDTESTSAALGIRPQPWSDALEQCLALIPHGNASVNR